MSTVNIPIGLRMLLIVATLFIVVYVVRSSIHEKMEIRYAILWITWAVIIFLFSIFPGIAADLAGLIGIYSVTNFLFLVMIALLFLFNYYLFLQTSKMKQDMGKMNYEIAELKRCVSEKNNDGNK